MSRFTSKIEHYVEYISGLSAQVSLTKKYYDDIRIICHEFSVFISVSDLSILI